MKIYLEFSMKLINSVNVWMDIMTMDLMNYASSAIILAKHVQCTTFI